MTKRIVLITGCSNGSLGAALALSFARHDFHVLATLRNLVKAASLASYPDIKIIPLDVTSSSSISSYAAAVEKKTGGRLDVLVNNAGLMFVMPLLDTSIEESKKLFGVNVRGLLAVTQAFAPMLVRSKGVVLNIASVYNSSKASARWISETLRIELKGLGVRVITAMVGEVETNIYDNASTPPSLPSSSYYASIKDLIFQQEITAENLVSDVLGGRDGHVWRGGVAGRAKYFHWILPERFIEWFLHAGRGVYQVKLS
ncbi:hypothetical protein BDR22DRAFT_882864 [Usnea florida]